MNKTRYLTVHNTNAPTLGQKAKEGLANVLKAALVDGINPLTPTTLSYAGALATATFGAAHGYRMYQVVRISGADDDAYNGDWRIVAMTDTSIQFALAAAPASTPDTGTSIECRLAPLGWELADEDPATWRWAFRSLNPQSNGLTLIIDGDFDDARRTSDNADTAWNYATWGQPFNTVDDFVPVVADFLMVGGFHGAASNDEVDDWYIVGDDRAFYFYVRSGRSRYRILNFYGEINSPLASDENATMYTAPMTTNGVHTTHENTNNSFLQFTYTSNWPGGSSLVYDNASTGVNMARAYNGAARQVPVRVAWNTENNVGHMCPYPDPLTNSLIVSGNPPFVREDDGGVFRGWMPGILEPLNFTPTPHGLAFNGVPGIEDVPVLALYVLSNSNTSFTTSTETTLSSQSLVLFRLDDWRDAQDQ